MADAAALANFTPQERFLYYHHMDNLLRGSAGAVRNPGSGSISTVYMRTAKGPDGRIYTIPSIWDGKVLDQRGAVQKAAAAGWDKWPGYKNEQQAQAAYRNMHDLFEQDVLGIPERDVMPLMPFRGKTMFTGGQ
jgi:hypothetical protein